MPISAAFISYARSDDRAYGGRITGLRQRLERMVGAAIGCDFEIFQDCEGIAWGQHWRSRLDEALEHALFLIPILTPGFFNSEACCAELNAFLELERRSGRNDRILPLYFLSSPVFEQKTRVLATMLRERQYRDWRQLRVDALGSPKVLRALDSLANEIAAATHRLVNPPAPAATGPNTTSDKTLGRQRSKNEELHAWVKAEDDSKGAEHPHAECPALGTTIKDLDAPWCPELVVIPAGSFLMGWPAEQGGANLNERPQHEVTIVRPFALGRFPLTFGEYDHFCSITGREKPDDEGWGRDRRPAINVTWDDAREYCQWLTQLTKQLYRLPSEAEWEYACRAGTTTPFWTGATISTDQANYDGRQTYARGAKGPFRGQTTPVDSFPANPWGLHDMHGNILEWCEDVWHDDYHGAPTDGSAWLQFTDYRRVARGGSWHEFPWVVRSANRTGCRTDGRLITIGFRVARTLVP